MKRLKDILFGNILCLCLGACTQGNQFFITAQTDTAQFPYIDSMAEIIPVDQSITARNALPYISDALYNSGFTIVESAPDTVVGYTLNDTGFTTSYQTPVYGKTGISSVDTQSRTSGTMFGTVTAPSKWSGNTYSYDGTYGTTTNTHSNINYEYGITDYNTHHEQHNYTQIKIGIRSIQKQSLIGVYTIGAYDATIEYLISYVPYVLPVIIGTNSNGNTVGVGCRNIYRNGDTYIECTPNSRQPNVSGSSGWANAGLALSAMLVASGNSY